jgi:hypothetical protein
MNRYFFEVVCEGREHIDWKGNHFSDLKAAKAHAAKIARELVQVSSDNVSCSVCIADEHGNELDRVSISGDVYRVD